MEYEPPFTDPSCTKIWAPLSPWEANEMVQLKYKKNLFNLFFFDKF